jgi:trk system potassium uptake protein TrkA
MNDLFILIVGGGKVGANLTRLLLEDGYEVAVIEQNRRKYDALEREFEHAAVFGDGTEITVLEKAGIARADYVLAVTGDDEDNVVIAQLAREKYGVENIIARVNNPKNEQTFDLLGIKPTVSSVSSILALVEHRLPHHRLLSLLSFEEEDIRMVELILSKSSPVVGKTLRELPFPTGILLIMILREHEAIIPHGEVRLHAEDHLIVFIEKGKEPDLFDIIGDVQRLET